MSVNITKYQNTYSSCNKIKKKFINSRFVLDIAEDLSLFFFFFNFSYSLPFFFSSFGFSFFYFYPFLLLSFL